MQKAAALNPASPTALGSSRRGPDVFIPTVVSESIAGFKVGHGEKGKFLNRWRVN